VASRLTRVARVERARKAYRQVREAFPVVDGDSKKFGDDHQCGHPEPVVGFDGHRNRMLGCVAFGRQRQQLCEAGGGVADPPVYHHMTAV